MILIFHSKSWPFLILFPAVDIRKPGRWGRDWRWGKLMEVHCSSTYTLILNTDSLYTSPSTPSAPPTSVWQAAWIAPDQLVHPSQFTVRWQGNFQLADSVTLWKHVVLISESMLLLFLSALCGCLYVVNEQVWKIVSVVWGEGGVLNFNRPSKSLCPS